MKRMKSLGILLTLMAILLTACGTQATPTPTQVDVEAVKTSAASTALARLTQDALLTPSATATATATETLAPTATNTVQPTIDLTLFPPTATLQPTSAGGSTTGDNAVLWADITIPDNTNISPGAGFTKTWRLKNTGTTTWLKDSYDIVHISTDAIQSVAEVNIPKDVPPGETVDVSVDMTAPTASGTHTSYWRVRNDRGQLFGESFFVKIIVGSGGTAAAPTATQGGGGGGALVTGISVSIDNPTYTGTCPYNMGITAQFTLSRDATVTYKLEAGSDTLTFTLPSPVSSSFSAGSHTLVFYLDMTDSGTGWVKFHITSPEDASSSQATFTLTCD